jgi:ATP-dependent DNA ligase
MATRTKARFVEPMLLFRTDELPDGPDRWANQLKLDGYRAIAFKTGGKVHLRSRNDNDFGVRYSGVLRGLARLPTDTVLLSHRRCEAVTRAARIDQTFDALVFGYAIQEVGRSVSRPVRSQTYRKRGLADGDRD